MTPTHSFEEIDKACYRISFQLMAKIMIWSYDDYEDHDGDLETPNDEDIADDDDGVGQAWTEKPKEDSYTFTTYKTRHDADTGNMAGNMPWDRC